MQNFVQVRKTGRYKGSVDDIKHVFEVLELLSVMEKDERYKKAYYYMNAEGGIHNMCDVLDRIEQMAVEKKEEEIKETYAKKMLAEGKPQAEVARFFGLSKSKVAKLARIVAAATV